MVVPAIELEGPKVADVRKMQRVESRLNEIIVRFDAGLMVRTR